MLNEGDTVHRPCRLTHRLLEFAAQDDRKDISRFGNLKGDRHLELASRHMVLDQGRSSKICIFEIIYRLTVKD